MATVVELIALSGLIALAISMIILNKRYDLKHDEMNPEVKKEYQ